MKRGTQKTVHGAYSGDFDESDPMAGSDLASLPSRKPGVYVVDKQPKDMNGIDLSKDIDKKFWDWRSGPVSDKQALKKG